MDLTCTKCSWTFPEGYGTERYRDQQGDQLCFDCWRDLGSPDKPSEYSQAIHTGGPPEQPTRLYSLTLSWESAIIFEHQKTLAHAASKQPFISAKEILVNADKYTIDARPDDLRNLHRWCYDSKDKVYNCVGVWLPDDTINAIIKLAEEHNVTNVSSYRGRPSIGNLLAQFLEGVLNGYLRLPER